MQNPAGTRHTEMAFQVDVVVPHKRGYAVALLDPARLQTFRQLSRAAVNSSPGGAMDRSVRQPGHNLDIAKVPANALQDGSKRQRVIHHRIHGFAHFREAFYPQTGVRRNIWKGLDENG